MLSIKSCTKLQVEQKGDVYLEISALVDKAIDLFLLACSTYCVPIAEMPGLQNGVGVGCV